MNNHEIAGILEETARLMELHGENEFKIRSYLNAARKIEKTPDSLQGKSPKELENLDGIGKSLSVKIHQLLSENAFPDYQHLLEITPEGVREMLEIKGLGPGKVRKLWKELEVESPGELLYACNENRLVELKGFGAKTQEQIRKAIEFRFSNRGYYHFAAAELSYIDFTNTLQKQGNGLKPEPIGEFRRRCEVVREISLLVPATNKEMLVAAVQNMEPGLFSNINTDGELLSLRSPSGIPISIKFVKNEEYAFHLWKLTGSDEHIRQCLEGFSGGEDMLRNVADENEIYSKLGLQWTEPELREGTTEIGKARNGLLPKALITLADLRGILHNHSTWSDGINRLEEMAIACRDLGFEYLGICDHSKSAQYANGLTVERVLEQHEEIDELNQRLSPFRIFKGIESDILSDGSLDYPDEILARFDFVVASVHSGLRMDQQKATDRLIKAIRNPFTSILGHPSGRLLLSREGYPLDYPAIIDACAENGVVIELNAHPYRLDLDWRWIGMAISKGVKISINPDAHSVEGYRDMIYGVYSGRKGFLTPAMTLNAYGRDEINSWFIERKKRAGL